MFSDWKGIPVILISSLILVLSSCETEIETNAPWKDITVVYGILDPHDSVQYIKINKAFLGEGNAITYASEPDSVQYSMPLNVRLIEQSEYGDSISTFYFDTITVNKLPESGQLFSPKQVLYRTRPYHYNYLHLEHDLFGNVISVDTFWLNDKSHYTLKIVNPLTGKIVSASTPLVKDFEITKPGTNTFIRFVANPSNPKIFSWEAAENGGKYVFEVLFNYNEILAGTNDTVSKSIVLVSNTIESTSGYTSYSFSYWDNYFFESCETLIPYDDPDQEANILKRITGTVDFIISIAAAEYSAYMDINSTGNISPGNVIYTNITNGIGIFSARFKKIKSKKLHAETIGELKSLGLKFVY